MKLRGERQQCELLPLLKEVLQAVHLAGHGRHSLPTVFFRELLDGVNHVAKFCLKQGIEGKKHSQNTEGEWHTTSTLAQNTEGEKVRSSSSDTLTWRLARGSSPEGAAYYLCRKQAARLIARAALLGLYFVIQFVVVLSDIAKQFLCHLQPNRLRLVRMGRIGNSAAELQH